MSGRRRSLAIAGAAWLLWGVLGAVAAGPTAGAAPGAVGTVVEAGSGLPIAGATVAMADGTGRVRQATTDVDGSFAFVPQADVVTSSAYAPGYLTVNGAGVLDGTIALAVAADSTDVDGDGLGHDDELALGTDPGLADSDGDHRPDGLEARVEAPFGAPGLGLVADHHEVHIEVYWDDDSSAYDVEHVAFMRDVFAGAPWTNPDGTTGSRVIVDQGEHGGGGEHPMALGCNGSWPDIDGFLAQHPGIVAGVDPGKRPYVYVMALVDAFPEDCTLNGVARFDDRITIIDRTTRYSPAGLLALAQRPDWQLLPDTFTVRELEVGLEAGTALHELGHNLSLEHGGDESLSCKPNYPSLMSYNPIESVSFDFSSGDRPTLDEHALDESFGLDGTAPLDLNGNGVIDPGLVAADIDNWNTAELLYPDSSLVLQAIGRCAPNGALTVLEDHDDWAAMRWDQPPLGAGVDVCDTGFDDVRFDHPFCDDVAWVTTSGYATGYADGTFRPAAAISRQAMAAFLHRRAGSPPVTLPATPTFADVGAGHPFQHEVEWAAAAGIVTGYADGGFHPADQITRQAMAVMLHRLAGSPAVTLPGTPTFADVAGGHPFAIAIEWVAAAGIAGGYADGGYHPGAAVSRQAMAAFLCRLDDLAAP